MAGFCRRLRSMMAQMRYYRHRQTIAVPVCLSLLAGVPLWPYPGLADNLIGAQAMGAAAGEGFGGSSELVDYRVMLRFDLLDPHALGENWLLESAVEVSLAYWQLDVPDRKNYSEGSDETWVGSVSPVFRLTAPGYWRHAWQPYLEGGLGAAWLQRKKLAAYSYEEGDLGSHLQFEDRIGVGVKFFRWHGLSVDFSLMHYSNANLGDTNDGINLRQLSITLPL